MWAMRPLEERRMSEYYPFVGQPSDLFSKEKIGQPDLHVRYSDSLMILHRDGKEQFISVDEAYALAYSGELSKALEPVQFTQAHDVRARITKGRITTMLLIDYTPVGHGKDIRGDDVVVFRRKGSICMYAKVGIVDADPNVSLSHKWLSNGYSVSALIMDMEEPSIRTLAQRVWVPQFTKMAGLRPVTKQRKK